MNDVIKRDETLLRHSIVWYLLGIGCLGLVVGYLTGFSESPVVGTILPLLFGLLGGTGGLFLAKADLQKSETRSRLNNLGKAFAIFSIAIVLSSGIAIIIKNQNISNASKQLTDLSSYIIDIDPQESLHLIALRKKLQILGASSVEQESILSKASINTELNPADPKHLAQYLRNIADASKKTLDELKFHESSLSNIAVFNDGESWEDILGLIPILESNNVLFNEWAELIEVGNQVSAFIIKSQIEITDSFLTDIVGSEYSQTITNLALLNQNTNLLRSIYDLRTAIDSNRPLMELVILSNFPDQDIEIETLTKELIKTQEYKTNQNTQVFRGLAGTEFEADDFF